MDESIQYCYCIVRSDLSAAQQIVQLGHACLEAGSRFDHPPNTPLVVLKVKNERKLLDAAVDLSEAEIQYSCFYEPDYGIGYSAIATESVIGIKRVFFEGFALI